MGRFVATIAIFVVIISIILGYGYLQLSSDHDQDGIFDIWDGDWDNDGVCNEEDNFPFIANPDQEPRRIDIPIYFEYRQGGIGEPSRVPTHSWDEVAPDEDAWPEINTDPIIERDGQDVRYYDQETGQWSLHRSH